MLVAQGGEDRASEQMKGASMRVIFSVVLLTAMGVGAPGLASHICGRSAPTTLLVGTYNDAFPIHGVGGDRALVFLAQPSPTASRAPGVHVMSRLGGGKVGSLPPPPSGFAVPLSVFVSEFAGIAGFTWGELLVADVRVPPAQAMIGPASAEIYRYHYSFSILTGLSAVASDTWSLPVNTVPPGSGLPDGLLYLGSFTVLPNGGYVFTDAFAGALWVADSYGGPVRLAYIDPRFAPAPVDSISGVQRAPGGGHQPYTLVLPAPPGEPSLGPGIESVTYANITDEVCVTPPAQGGIYCIDRATLFDSTLPPFAKAPRVVIAPQPGLSDLTDGLTYDRFHPQSPWLYWHRAPSDTTSFSGSGYNTLRRVNLLTGKQQVVAKSNDCFDWTYEIAPLPPLVPGSPLTHIISSVGQAPNDGLVNGLLQGQSTFVAPTPVPFTITNAY